MTAPKSRSGSLDESTPEREAGALHDGQDGDEEVEDALDLLFAGHVEQVLPPEELNEFHNFIRDEALRRRRFAVSFRVECGCLAWIGYSLGSIVTHEEGIEFRANPVQSYVPDHEPDVEHPEGPTEDPPTEFADWPIWPFEIYQDELEHAEGLEGFNEELDEAVEDLHLDREDDLGTVRRGAYEEDPLVDRGKGGEG